MAQTLDFDVFFGENGDAAVALAAPSGAPDLGRACLVPAPDGAAFFRDAGEALRLPMAAEEAKRLLRLPSVVIVETDGPAVVRKYTARVKAA